MSNKNSFGIDLGTLNLRVYNKNNDGFHIEKNVIAIQNRKDLLAYGDSAYEMYEKNPSTIEIIFPLSNGVIGDICNMRLLISNFINFISAGDYKGATYYLTIPTDVTEVEKKAFYDLVKESNLKHRGIYLIDKSVANGIGLDIDVKNAQGVLVVDVGYNTTEISVLSLGGIVSNKMIKMGGEKFDDVICQTVKKQNNIIIGKKTAEDLRIILSSTDDKVESATIYGRDAVSGMPIEKTIMANKINEALEGSFNTIVDSVRVILERTPPALAADIFKRGLYLTGGASTTTELAKLIAKSTGLRINMAKEPLNSTVAGIAKIVDNPDYKSVLYSKDRLKGDILV